MDEVASRILDALFARDGSIEGEAGTVLVEIASITDCNYFGVTVAVRKLEEIGFIQVDRKDSPDPRRGNWIEGVYIV